ncbi:MAG: RDD family protein [Caldilineaceae bacterium]|nr:RDD family protein [Caldilineaceae bacterium]
MNADVYPPPARLGLRVIAYCLDIGGWILHAMIWTYAFTFMVMMQARWPLNVSTVLSLLIVGAWFKLAARGQTIGKVLVGLHVILMDGKGNQQPLGIPQMFARTVIKILGAVVVLPMVVVLPVFLDLWRVLLDRSEVIMILGAVAVLPVFLNLWLVLSDRSYCRTIADRVLNSRVVEIPPGAEEAGPGSIPPARLGLRAIAYCLDIGVWILHAMIWSYHNMFKVMVQGVWPLYVAAAFNLAFVVAWFKLAARGRTIGKVLVGLHVILMDGKGNQRPLDIPRMFARAVIKILPVTVVWPVFLDLWWVPWDRSEVIKIWGAVAVWPVFLDLWWVLSDRSDRRTIADRALNSRVVEIPPGAAEAGPGSTTVNLEPKA